MKKVCLVFGGNGSEAEVSFNSSRSILKALQTLNFEVVELEFDGNFIEKIQQIKPDVVFNAMHGTWGEDGTIQTLLDFLQIPYTHSGRVASITAMNKAFTKQIAESLGIPIIKSYTVTKSQILSGNFRIFEKTFIKPCSEGSTIGCVRLEERKNLTTEELQTINSTPENFFLVEEFYKGTEVSVGIFEGKPIGGVEISPKSGYYDYKSKYTKGETEYFIPPRISPEMLAKLEDVTFKIYTEIGISGVARADFLINGQDFRFLEINTHPGFTSTSLVPKMAEKQGITFENLVLSLVKNAKFTNYQK